MKKIILIFLSALLFLSLFISCNDGFPLVSEMWEKSGRSSGKGTSHTIIVKAEAAAKTLGQSDPEFTYTYEPDPLPSGVSLTGTLIRDAGEYEGTYVIRQGTVELTGTNAGKYTLKYISNIFSIND